MNTTIFIVSCAKHLEYLKYSIRSLAKFATGFHEIVLMFPRNQLEDLHARISTRELHPVELKPFDEWPEKGMLHHEFLEMTAPGFCYGADCILHWDSDYVATEPINPADFVQDGKPVMVWAPYEWLAKQQPNILNWQRACEKALGYAPENEFMRRPGLCHIKEVYPEAWSAVVQHTQMPLGEYLKMCKNSYPQDFAEYPLLGEIAWKKFHDRYVWIQQGVDAFPPLKIQQLWGHGPMDSPQNVWVKGEQKVIIPRQFCEDLGLGDHRPSMSSLPHL